MYINLGISHDNKFDLLVYTNMYKYMLEFACIVKQYCVGIIKAYDNTLYGWSAQ